MSPTPSLAPRERERRNSPTPDRPSSETERLAADSASCRYRGEPPQQIPRDLNIVQPLGGVLCFALDGERALVADLLQLGDEPLHADGALAERFFFAERAGRILGRPIAVFAVDREDVVGESVERGDRVAGAVEDHVGWVEIDTEIFAVHTQQKIEQRVRGLLAGLERN